MAETYIVAVVTPPEGGGRVSLSHRLSGRLSHRLSGGVSLYPLTALALAACGGGQDGGGSPIPDTDPTPTPTEAETGRVFDGPVAGAQVYFDVNANGVQDDGDVWIGESDALGQFTISGEDVDKYGADKPLLAVLDEDIDLGDDLDDPSDDTLVSGIWHAPVGSRIISPLTNLLVRAEIDNERVTELVGLSPDIDVTRYDPYETDTPDETALAVIAVAQEVAEVLADLDATDEEVTPDEIATVVERVVTSESPTEFTLNPVVTTLAEDADTGTRTQVATLAVTDADTESDAQTYLLSGDDTSLFEVDGATLYLRTGAAVDYETNPSLDVTVKVVGTSPALTQDFALTITNVASAPVLTASGTQALTLNEGTTNPAAATGFSFAATDEDNDTVTLSVDDDRFEIIGGVLSVKANQVFDFETEPSITLTITGTDDSTGTLTDTETVTITITNVASAPVLTASGTQALTLNEGTTNPAGATGYSFTATDEDGDTVTLSVDDARFEITTGGVLNVKANQTFDYETEETITLTITATAGGQIDTQTVTITITNVASAPVLTASGTQALTLNEGTTNPAGATGYSFTATDEDGDTVILSVDDARFEIIGGVLNVKANQTFDYETEETITLTITATAGGQTDTEEVTITITNVASAPVLTASGTQALTLNEGTTNPAGATGFSFTATDEDGDTVTLSVDDARFEITPGGVLNVKANQTFDYETEETITLIITATAGGQTDTQTVTITITNVASAPVLTASGSQTLTLEEGTTNPAEATGFSFTATDEDGDTVTLSVDDVRFEITTGGVLNVKANQTFDYETEETITLTITATAGGQTDTETVTITITNVASAPVLTASGTQALTLNEGTTNPAGATGYSFTATDEDGDTVTLSVDDARFEITPGGVLNVKANQTFDYETEETITLIITATAGGQTDTQTVTITITNVASAPVLTASGTQALTLNEGTTNPAAATGFSFAATDEDNDGVTLSVDDARFEIIGGVLNVKANQTFDYETEETITLIITATAGGQTDTETVTITITNVASAPVLTASGSQTLTLEEGTTNPAAATGFSFAATDEDNDTVTLSVDDNRFEIIGGVLSVKANQVFDFETESSITLTITGTDDSTGTLTDTETVTITITNVASAPVLTASGPQTLTLNEGTTNPAAATGYSFAATDEDNDTVTLSVSDDRFEITTGGVLNVKANQTFDYETEETITLIITATAGGQTDTQTVTITITNVASAPVLTASGSQTLTLEEGTTNPAAATGFSFAATDEDNDTVTLSVDDNRFEIIGGVLSVKANQVFDFETESSITLTITGTDDSTGTLTDTETVTITITNVASAPVLTASGPQTLTLNEGTTNPAAATGYSFAATDEDNDTVTLSVSDDRFEITTGGVLSVKANQTFDYETEETITLIITATAGGQTDTETVTITITNVASAPVLTASGSQTLTLNEGTTNPAGATGFSFTATDEDGDTVTLSVDDARFEIIGGVLNVKANQVFDFETEPSITLTITGTDDSTGTLTDTEEVTITITNVASAPVLTASGTQALTLNEGTTNPAGATGFSFTATDEDGDTVTLSVDDARFEITPGGVLNVKANQTFDYETEETITLIITATAGGQTDTQTVTITITNVASAPVLTASGTQTLTLNEGTTNPAEATGFSFTATDEDGDTVTLSVDDVRFEITTGGVLNVKANQVFDFETEPSITLTITGTDDSTGTLTDTETVTITITNVASAPVLTASGSQTLTLNEGTTNPAEATGYSFTATDEDGDTVTLSVDDARFEITTGGVLNVKANQTFDYETEETITLIITATAGGQTDTETVTITITNVASAPVLTTSGSQTLTLNEGTTNPAEATGFSFTATDEDNDGVTLSVDDARFEIIGGVLNVKANQTFDYETEETITLIITATAGGQTDTETVTITITNVASAPVLTASGSQTLTLEEGTTNPAAATGFSFAATDEDNDTVTLSVDDNRFEIIGGVLSVKANQVFDFETESSITLTITGTDDSTGTLTDTETVTITITNVASAPVLTASGPQTLTLNEGTTNPAGATGYSFAATDEDNDTVTLSVSDDRFEITTGGVLNVKANQTFDYETEETITLIITATAGGQTDTQTVTITITNVASAPVLTASGSQTLTLEEGTTNPAAATGFSFAATDEDNDTVTLSVDDNRFEIIGGVLNVKANQTFDFETEPSITLTITGTDDSTGTLTDTETVTITITNVASAPVLTASGTQALTLNEGTTNPAGATGYSFTATDEDGDTVTLSVDDARFEITPGGVLNVKANQTFDYETEETITLTITATAGGQIDTQTVTITITNVASAPVLTASGTQALTLNEGTTNPAGATGYSFTATDEDGDTVTLSVDDARFEITPGGVLNVKANQTFDYETEETITLTITATAGGQTDTETVTITITNVASAPVLTASGTQTLTLNEGTTNPAGATGYSFTATDEDGDTVTLSVDDARFEITPGGVLNVKANQTFDYETEPSITLTITGTDDSTGTLTDTETVTITITNVASAPVLTASGTQALTLNEGTTNPAGATGFSFTATDEDGDTVTLSVDDARFEITPGGVLNVKANQTFDYETEETITLIITATAGGQTDTQTVTITITNVASAPVLTASGTQTLTLNEGTTNPAEATGFSFTATDEDGDTVTLSVDDVRFEITTGGVLNVKANQVFDFETEPSITLTITGTDDSTGTLTDTETVTITITNVASAPVLTASGSQTLTLNEGTTNPAAATGYSFTATDEDGDTVTLSVDDARFEITPGGVLNVKANQVFDFETEPSITLTITATAGGQIDTQTVTITITNVASAPVLTASGTQALTLNEGTTNPAGATGYSFTATDEDGDTVTLSVDDARFEITPGGVLNVKANQTFDYETEETITLTITATAGGQIDTQTVTITITNVASAPVLTASGTQALTLNEGTTNPAGATGYSFTATDEDGDTVTLSVDDARFEITPGGVLNVKANQTFDYETEETITLTITATAGGQTATQTVEITITDVVETVSLSALTSADVGGSSTPAFGDVDGDGDLDVLVGNNLGRLNFFRWGEDDGTGTGWSAQTLAAPLDADVGSSSTPAFGDVDGDGDMDVLVGEFFGTLSFYRWGESDGTGTGWTAVTGDGNNPFHVANRFANAETFDVGDFSSPTFGDVDGDGDMDVLVGEEYGTLSFYRWGESDGTGTGWSEQTGSNNPFDGVDIDTPSIGNTDIGYSSPTFGDVDGDGDMDLLVGEWGGTLHFFRWGDGSGTEGSTGWSVQIGANNPFHGVDVGGLSKPTFGDVDGDGDMDVLVGAADGTLNIWYWIDATNTWSTTTDVDSQPVISVTGSQNTLEEGAFGTETATGYSVTATDLNGDTVTLSVSDNRFSIDDDGNLNIVAGSVFDFETENPLTLTITGTDDSTSALTTTTKVTITLTDVVETVSLSALIDAAVGGSSTPVFGDVDGDGDMDLVVGAVDGILNFYRWGAGDGTGTGWSAVTGTDNPFSDTMFDVGANSAPAFGDVDGDGDLDLLIGKSGGRLDFFRWGGATDTVASPGMGWSVQTLASTSSSLGGFVSPGGQPKLPTPAFGDVDGDGDLDVLVGNNLGRLNFFRWGEDDGTGTGWSAVTGNANNPFHAASTSPFDVGVFAAPAFGDVDGDGDMDVLVGSGVGTLNFFRRGTANDGTAADSTKSWTAVTGTDNPFDGVEVGQVSTPAFGDVDGDGDLDLLLGEFDGNLNVFYWNQSTNTWSITSDLDSRPVLSVTGTQNTLNEGTVAAETATGYTVTATDRNGDNVAFSVDDARFSIDDDGNINIVAGSVFDFETESPLTLTITGTDDSTSRLTTTQTVEITITDVVGTAFSPTALIDAAVGFDFVPAFGDVDGDGDMDVLVGERDGTLNFFRWGAADGTGTGWSAVTGTDNPFSDTMFGVGANSAPAFGDVDGDGDIDLLIGKSGGRLDFFRWGEDDGTGTGWSAVTGTDNPFSDTMFGVGGLSTPTFGDVDGDGDMDVLVGAGDGTLTYYRWGAADGTGTGWSEVTGSNNPFADVAFDVGWYSAPAFGDVDGDGDLDVLVGDILGTLNFFRRGTANDGTAADSTKSWTAVTGTNNPFHVADPDAVTPETFDVGDDSKPAFGDVDGDGDLDLLVGANDGNLNIWYWDDANDTWSTTTDVEII